MSKPRRDRKISRVYDAWIRMSFLRYRYPREMTRINREMNHLAAKYPQQNFPIQPVEDFR